MFRKLIYAGMSIYLLTNSFASYSFLEDEPKERVSIYSPIDRLGFDGSIESVCFTNVTAGPADRHFYLASSSVSKVARGSFNFDEGTLYGICSGRRGQTYIPSIQTQLKDRISTYGIARLTFDSYEEQCKQLRYATILNNLNVELDPHDQECVLGPRNAYYSRKGSIGGQGSIKFCSQGLTTANIFDIVAHEVGHSILDTLRPGFYGHSKDHPYTALHESFGDISTVFASIRLAKLCNSDEIPFFLESGSLCLAPGLQGPQSCLRMPTIYNGHSCEAHDHSNYFTSFFFNAMQSTFNLFSWTAYNGEWVSDFYQRLLVYSVVNTQGFNNLYEFAQSMESNVYRVLSLNDRDLELPIIDVISGTLERYSANLMSCPQYKRMPDQKRSLYSPFN